MTGLVQNGPQVLAAFLASFVEFVEALTVILAVGSVRGWRGALGGAAAATGVLALVAAVLGSALTRVPIELVQGVVGMLMILFGLRWLRKAVLRAAGIVPLHDETIAFARQAEAMRWKGKAAGWDSFGFATTFQVTMVEGAEVVFIVIAVSGGGGSSGGGVTWPAAGALAALLVVALLGLAVRRPLARVPENTLKFAVGVLLSGFGTFWVGEALGLRWPGADWSLLALVGGFLLVARLGITLCRRAGSRKLAAP